MARPRGTDIYHIAVAQSGDAPARWECEIYRDGQPLPIRLRGGNFASEGTAMTLGKVALREFLEALARDSKKH